MASRLGFLAEGCREVGRRVHRFGLRRRLVATDRERQQALTRLGRTAWQSKVALAGLSGLRGELEQFDARAGELSAAAARIDAERNTVQARRQAEVDRFESLLAPARQAQSQADAALRMSRAALDEKAREMRATQAQLAHLDKDDDAGQRSALVQQSAAHAAARAPLEKDVNLRTEESRRWADETARLEAERRAALHAIDGELDRLKQASSDTVQGRAALAREQDARFLDLGAGLYERREADPALANDVNALDALAAQRAATQADIEASMGLTRAMQRGTMAKFGAAVLAVPVVFVTAMVVGVGERVEPQPVVAEAPLPTPAAAVRSAALSVAADESRKDELVLAFRKSPGDPAASRQGVEVLAADLRTLGSSADRSVLPLLLAVLDRGEPSLRAAAADALGMIGPSPTEAPALVKALNDPMPAVRDRVLHALGQVKDDASARLLVQRVRAAQRDGQHPGAGGFVPTVVPDAGRLAAPIYPGAEFLAFASDLELGRTSFATTDPLEKVVGFYAAAGARPAVGGEEFSRLYFGATAADPTGMDAMYAEFKAWVLQMGPRLQEPEVLAEFQRREGEMRALPLVQYAERSLFGAPVFIATEVDASEGRTRVRRYVAVFQDLALGRPVFEHHTTVAGRKPR